MATGMELSQGSYTITGSLRVFPAAGPILGGGACGEG
jgi:hypothetical protein